VVAVEQRFFLVGEVVRERAPGDSGLVGDGLHRDLVGAVREREAHGGLVQCLPGRGLLALPETHLGGRRAHTDEPNQM
jgi:hypothetical protein